MTSSLNEPALGSSLQPPLIYKLPNEIFSKIFRDAKQIHDASVAAETLANLRHSDTFNRETSPWYSRPARIIHPDLALSQISSLLREVALSTPQLWTHIKIGGIDTMERVQTYIERSSPSCEIHVNFLLQFFTPNKTSPSQGWREESWSHSDYQAHVRPMLDIIIPTIPRWKSLTIYCQDGGSVTRLMALYSHLRDAPAPVLRKVHVDTGRRLPLSESDGDDTTPLHVNGEFVVPPFAPDMSICSDDSEVSDVLLVGSGFWPRSMHSVRTLRIMQPEDDGTFCFGSGYTASAQLFDNISRAASLVELDIQDICWNNWESLADASRIDLPRLKRLRLRGPTDIFQDPPDGRTPPAGILEIIYKLNTPSLQFLALADISQLDLLAVGERYPSATHRNLFPALYTLELYHGFSAEDALLTPLFVQMAQTWPGLARLQIPERPHLCLKLLKLLAVRKKSDSNARWWPRLKKIVWAPCRCGDYDCEDDDERMERFVRKANGAGRKLPIVFGVLLLHTCSASSRFLILFWTVPST